MTPQEYIESYTDVCHAAQIEIVKYPTIGACWPDTTFPDWLIRCYANTGLNEADRGAWIEVADVCASYATAPEVVADIIPMIASATTLRECLATMELLVKAVSRSVQEANIQSGLYGDTATIELYRVCRLMSNAIRARIACPVT